MSTAVMNPSRGSETGAGFAHLAVSPRMIRTLERLGWTEPTPIQKHVIPLVISGRDVAGQAETGSGKTGAFGIPLAEQLDPTRAALQALVLVPTRELALQVGEALRALGRERALRVVVLFGGQSIGTQLADLQRRPHIAVATPGRLLDHIDRRSISLATVQMVVLDEADRLLDMGFLPDVSRILDQTPRQRQTALFSATIPAAVRAIAERHMRDPLWVRLSALVPTVNTVDQFYFEVAEEDKVRGLRRLLREDGIDSALIFRRTKHRADRLARALAGTHQRRDVEGRPMVSAPREPVGVLHGGMAQGARLAALRAFAQRRTKLLIATNLAARGLDLPDISHVINFDMPEDVDSYVHRVGRTARMGRAGTAITFVGQYDREMLDQLQRKLGPALKRHPLNIYR